MTFTEGHFFGPFLVPPPHNTPFKHRPAPAHEPQGLVVWGDLEQHATSPQLQYVSMWSLQ